MTGTAYRKAAAISQGCPFIGFLRQSWEYATYTIPARCIPLNSGFNRGAWLLAVLAALCSQRSNLTQDSLASV